MIYNSNTLTTQCLLLGYKTIFCALIDRYRIRFGVWQIFFDIFAFFISCVHANYNFPSINYYILSITLLILVNLQLDQFKFISFFLILLSQIHKRSRSSEASLWVTTMMLLWHHFLMIIKINK